MQHHDNVIVPLDRLTEDQKKDHDEMENISHNVRMNHESAVRGNIKMLQEQPRDNHLYEHNILRHDPYYGGNCERCKCTGQIGWFCSKCYSDDYLAISRAADGKAIPNINPRFIFFKTEKGSIWLPESLEALYQQSVDRFELYLGHNLNPYTHQRIYRHRHDSFNTPMANPFEEDFKLQPTNKTLVLDDFWEMCIERGIVSGNEL